MSGLSLASPKLKPLTLAEVAAVEEKAAKLSVLLKKPTLSPAESAHGRRYLLDIFAGASRYFHSDSAEVTHRAAHLKMRKLLHDLRAHESPILVIEHDVLTASTQVKEKLRLALAQSTSQPKQIGGEKEAAVGAGPTSKATDE